MENIYFFDDYGVKEALLEINNDYIEEFKKSKPEQYERIVKKWEQENRDFYNSIQNNLSPIEKMAYVVEHTKYS